MDALKELRAVNQTEFDDLQLYFLISCIVFGATIAILAGAVIGLYVWVFKINKSQNKNAQFSSAFRSRGRTLQPNEELAKRYVMSAEDERRLNREESMLEPFPFNKQQTLKQPDILKNDNSKTNTNVASSTKHLDKRSESREGPGIKRFGDNFVDELYY